MASLILFPIRRMPDSTMNWILVTWCVFARTITSASPFNRGMSARLNGLF
jgi:hypothetical protein